MMPELSNYTLLAVLAHPDDESFGPGGTLAKYAAEGVDVHVCIVTDGAAGSYDPAFLEGYKTLVQRRRAELEAAVRVLGATLHTLPYRDSGMKGSEENRHPDSLYQAPLDEVALHLVRLMRQVRPDVVVTHDPTGDYFHPDHIKVNQAMSQAWAIVNDPEICKDSGLPPWQPQRLYWTAMPRQLIGWFIRVLRLLRRDPTRFGRNGDVDLTELGTPDEQIHCVIDIRNYYHVKEAASRAHASQYQSTVLGARLPFVLRRRLFGREFFTQAVPDGETRSHSLFEGLPHPDKG